MVGGDLLFWAPVGLAPTLKRSQFCDDRSSRNVSLLSLKLLLLLFITPPSSLGKDDEPTITIKSWRKFR